MRAHDEVCGMTIDAETAAASTEFQGKTYYFCTERCQRKFDEHPERFVSVREEDEYAQTSHDQKSHAQKSHAQTSHDHSHC